jgi:prepilin-type N-terminal cleavage/methylation domain-containing protein
MKNQKGFTLVELMVVMAIIAILSTAGISQYGKFIKGARDTTRLEDLKALNIVILDSIQAKGVVPEIDDLPGKIKEVAGKSIIDPLDGATACLEEDGVSVVDCHYQYAVCDGGTWYIIATAFENKNNALAKYQQDNVSSENPDDVLNDNLYEIGTCNEIIDGPEVIISGEVSI